MRHSRSDRQRSSAAHARCRVGPGSSPPAGVSRRRPRAWELAVPDHPRPGNSHLRRPGWLTPPTLGTLEVGSKQLLRTHPSIRTVSDDERSFLGHPTTRLREIHDRDQNDIPTTEAADDVSCRVSTTRPGWEERLSLRSPDAGADAIEAPPTPRTSTPTACWCRSPCRTTLSLTSLPRMSHSTRDDLFDAQGAPGAR